MRKHAVNCQIENEKKIEYIQSKINETTILYIKEQLSMSEFTKEEKLTILDMLIAYI